MAAPFEIHQPSQEQMEARLAEWKGKLEGKYVAEEKPLDEQMRERFPSLNLQTLPEDAKPVSDDDKWHYKVGDKDVVKPSEIEYEVRHLWPGRPATRDLRFDRMNLHTDNDGKIARVTFG
ncbi:hypothetical protein EV183_001802 [Coemansia sp. RSA 2336]|nr:hypothetical protein EV183_001802 [Coemansia sp. RSA 2336]